MFLANSANVVIVDDLMLWFDWFDKVYSQYNILKRKYKSTEIDGGLGFTPLENFLEITSKETHKLILNYLQTKDETILDKITYVYDK